MDQTSLLRRVSNELHRLTLQNGGTSRGPDDMLEDARAILHAMRPLSSEMRAAGARQLTATHQAESFEAHAALAWTGIIDHALSDS